MKKIYLFIITIIGVNLFYACENDLLDTKPYDAISSAGMWNTENLADLGVVGVYETLRENYVGLNRWYFDQDAFTGMNRDQKPLTRGNVTAGEGLFKDYWQQNYEGIHRANDAIVNLQENAPLSDEKRGRLVAECKFLRAWFYYNLNQVFKGVPLYLEPTTLQEADKARSSESEVWQAIIADLTDCVEEPNFPDFYDAGNGNKGRATKAAAYALRGKAYMYTEEYAKAEADLRKVGDLGPELYQGEYRLLFKEVNEQHPEMIFSVQNIGLPGLGSITQKFVGVRVSFGSCWNNYLPHPDWVESFEEKDGSPFNWNDYLPGYNSMTPAERTVFFLRDGLTNSEIQEFTDLGADMSQYLPNGNEARIIQVYEDRDPRLTQLVITPYSTYLGSSGGNDYTYTMRWPYRGADRSEPFDLRTDTRDKFYYTWRKWVAEGTNEIPSRNYSPIDQPLIRYADVVLLLAEAINEQGFDPEAIDLVNSVRERAGVIPLQATDANAPTFVSGQDNLRERIRNERRWEFGNEGINLFDEMRWETWKEKKFTPDNGIKEIYGTITAPYSWRGDYIYNWAIPQVEIERNSNIEQNPGWIN